MAKSEVMDILEEAVDVVDETLDTLERIPKVRLNGTTRNQQLLILGATVVAGALAGGGIMHYITKKRMTLIMDEVVAEQVAETRAFYQRMDKPPLEELASQKLPMDAQVALERAVEAVQVYNGTIDRAVAEEVPETVTHNIFVEGQPMRTEDFDYDTEVPLRDITKPYIITRQEFDQGEKDYIQNSLVWWEGDETLTDNANVPIEAIDDTVGEFNLTRFGHGSGDPNILYVRNDVIENDFEVAKQPKGYAETVLGFQHSDRPGSKKDRRFRRDDE